MSTSLADARRGADARALPLTVSLFSTAMPVGPAFGTMERTTWGAFAARLKHRREGEKDGANFSPSTYEPDPEAPGGGIRRLKERALTRTAVVLDCETNKTTGEIPSAVADVVRRLEEIGVAAIVYTSHRHDAKAPRYRVVAPLSAEVEADLPVAEVLAAELGLGGVIDSGKVGASSLFYFPSCEPGQWAKHQVAEVSGAPLSADWMRERAKEIVADREAEEAKVRAAAMEAAARRREERISQGFDPDSRIIEAVRQRLDLEGLLLQHGYTQPKKAGGKGAWLYPKSESGVPGVHIMTGRDGVRRVYSHHSADPLAEANLPDWCRSKAVDAVDIAAILEFGGDLTKTLRELAKRFGLDAKGKARERRRKLFGHLEVEEPEWLEVTTAEDADAEPTGTTGTDGTRDTKVDPDVPLPVVYFDNVEPALDTCDFVEGLLTNSGMSVVYGPSNCGKTFFMTDLALHIAAGWKWRGREVDQGGVIYCALEGGHGITNRVAAFKRHHKIAGTIPFAIVPVTLNLLDPEADRAKLVITVRGAAKRMGSKVVLVVVDTLSRAMAGGNENAPDDMGALVASADWIRQELKCHVCFIHHSGKDQAAGARGHSLLRAATDTEIEISRQDKDSPSVAKVTKQRDLEIDGVFGFKLASVALGENRRGKQVTSCVVEAIGEAEIPAGKARLSPGAMAGRVALHHALIESGRPGTEHTMPGTTVVPLDQWRKHFYARSHLETQEARKKAFQRAVTDLQRARAVGVLNDHAWEVRDE